MEAFAEHFLDNEKHAFADLHVNQGSAILQPYMKTTNRAWVCVSLKVQGFVSTKILPIYIGGFCWV